ncbi:hypothetical protein PanWU01x14_065400 [Parasponia andersonii]|uniref:Uncharacterized protein n=1 Tax=Parasponia andersonii TaxID=3476 RepID=A0A2P5DGV4_PARAD|nr:hypothetical protein PanWU01x14_065400 [Parasponia andersonii]
MVNVDPLAHSSDTKSNTTTFGLINHHNLIDHHELFSLSPTRENLLQSSIGKLPRPVTLFVNI